MKKIVFVLVVLMLTTSVWAGEVLITCAQDAPGDPNVTIGYVNTTGQPVRAFALNIKLDNDEKITDVNCNVNSDYYVYPGSIQIDGQGNVTDWGSCVADAGQYPVDTLPGLDSNGITVEMGALYVGEANAPADSGDLLKIKVSGECNISITGNVLRGKVVLEDATSVDPNASGCSAGGFDCFPSSDPKYGQWVAQGKPKAWCCAHQGDGDATGDGIVNIFDLITLKAAWGGIYPAAPYDCRADYTHDGKVNIFDLIKLKSNWGTNYGEACQSDWKNDCGS